MKRETDIDVEIKEAQLRKEKDAIINEGERVLNDNERVKVEKINCLLNLLAYATIDPDNTIIGSEQKFQLVISNEKDRKDIQAKIMTLVKSF